jgi:hypothetical protein
MSAFYTVIAGFLPSVGRKEVRVSGFKADTRVFLFSRPIAPESTRESHGYCDNFWRIFSLVSTNSPLLGHLLEDKK